jgi:hypothetical protein
MENTVCAEGGKGTLPERIEGFVDVEREKRNGEA